jgi:ABC-type branched-subunit amino acid transport system ATPase component
MVVLELDDIEKQYGGLPALDGVDLRVAEGEILALVGPNGAGKSTLLKAVSGIERPSRGAIHYLGADITRLARHRIRRAGIAMVQQTPRLFESMTVRANVAVGAMFGDVGDRLSEEDAWQRADEALDIVGLAPRAGDTVAALNLHAQRFVELARALAGRPTLLLVDEVMAGLNDSELQASVDIVRTARDRLGLTVIWVEHVMTAVMSLADRVAVLNFGRILADGEPREVMRDPAVVTAYLGEGKAADA